jgi:spore coat polysaccharide biosynthesis protein SpsF
MLGQVVARVRAARTIDEVVIATSTHPGDDDIVREAERLGAGVFRGSESDVLSRYLGAARAYGASVIVRVTSDCPLLDPTVLDLVVDALRWDVDYASNTHRRSFPRGLDVEALFRETLERIASVATSQQAREHVTAYIVEQPHEFRVRHVVDSVDHSDLRWTVDTPEDLELVRQIYALSQHRLPYHRLVELVRARPDLAAINAHIVQKQIHVR